MCKLRLYLNFYKQKNLKEIHIFNILHIIL